MKKKVIVIVGPSGAGKTVSGQLLESWGIPRVISTTTKEPKSWEINGLHYHFCNRSEFENTDLIEFTEYDNNYYGVSKAELMDKWSKSDLAFLVADVNGVLAFKDKYPDNTIVLYIVAPPKELESRMVKRGDSEGLIKNRLEIIENTGELNNLHLADYVIVNNEWETTVALLDVIIQSAQGNIKEQSTCQNNREL